MTAPRLSWFERIVGHPVPGLGALDAVEAIPARRALLADPDLAPSSQPADVVVQTDVAIRQRDGVALTAEIVRPAGASAAPIVVWVHGGAWCSWSPREVRRATFRLAARGFVVVAPDYGLAPEHPFPWAVEDVVYTLRWIAGAARDHGGDPARIALAGDSAGANLAAAAAVQLAGHGAAIDEGDLAGTVVELQALLLCCGTYDFPARSQDARGAPGLVELMGNLAYLGPHFLRRQRHPLVSPFHAASRAGLPATYVSCGAQDAILSQSLAFAVRLADDGVRTTVSVVEDVDHEFLLQRDAPARTEREWDRIADWLAAQHSSSQSQ